MTFGNLATRPDLRPLFGPLSDGENDHLLDRLLAVNARLADLAVVASKHVGVLYKPVGLGLVVRTDSAGIHGGPSGDAGDLWFDVDFSFDSVNRRVVAPPWTIESSIFVFCVDAPEPRGSANNHALVQLTAFTTRGYRNA